MQTTTADLELQAAPPSAGAARRFIVDTLKEWDHAEMADIVVFLANELVTNAILHARGRMRLTLRRTRGRLRCEVTDESREEPAIRSYAVDDLTGRGLALVVAMASSWGVDKNREGKCVWFEMDT